MDDTMQSTAQVGKLCDEMNASRETVEKSTTTLNTQSTTVLNTHLAMAADDTKQQLEGATNSILLWLS